MSKKIKKILAPVIFRIMYFKVARKQIFVNRYTKKIPVLKLVINKAEKITLLAQSKHQIKVSYYKWLEKNYPSDKKINEQKRLQKEFKKRPLISVLVPTYNTKIEHLRACIESVLKQSYDSWELCIADDFSKNDEVRKVINEYAQNEKRIKKAFRNKNGHICEASNSALALASGEFIALLDHDDILWPNALFETAKLINQNPDAEFLYSDEDKIDEAGKTHTDAFFKPDWSPEFLRSINYITHFAVIKRKLVEEAGGFRPGYEGAQDWDLFLRVSRKTDKIYHVPTVLYSWRKTEQSTALQPSAKDYAYVNQKNALLDDIKSRGLQADIKWQIPFSMWRVDYKIIKNPMASIIIPTKNSYEYISRCLESIYEKTSYKNYEIVIVDTGTDDEKVLRLYKDLPKNTRVIKWTEGFNFSSVCNYGAKNSNGKYLLFLNNDTEIISGDWLESMLGYAQQKDIGAVGAKLYYPGGKLQHGGIVLGVGGNDEFLPVAGHIFPAYLTHPVQSPQQDTFVGGTRNFSAVTAACLMVSKAKFDTAGGFDPKFKIAFNDVDFCLKLLDKGWRNVYLPHVELVHHESVSVGKIGQKVRDKDLFKKEINLMIQKWNSLISDDPYYHPEFRRDIANAQLPEKMNQ